MAGIKNEIVKFIADVELDPQQAAQYQKSLEDCEKSADALRSCDLLSEFLTLHQQQQHNVSENVMLYSWERHAKSWRRRPACPWKMLLSLRKASEYASLDHEVVSFPLNQLNERRLFEN